MVVHVFQLLLKHCWHAPCDSR